MFRNLLQRFPILVVMFRKAYIDDRGWVDALRGYDPGCKDLPQVGDFDAALKAHRAEDINRAWEALERARKAYTHQVRAARNFQRIGVQANICPIFWMTILALAIYFPLVVPIRGFGRFLYRRATPIRQAFAYSVLALMLSFGTAYEHEYPGTAASVGNTIGSGALAAGEFLFVDMPVGIFYKFPMAAARAAKKEYADYQEQQRQEREWAKEQRLIRRQDARRAREEDRRFQEWKREHPALARLEHERDAAFRALAVKLQAEEMRTARAWQRKQDAEDSAALKHFLLEMALWIIVPAAILAVLLWFSGLILDFALALFVYLVFIKLGVRPDGALDRALRTCVRVLMGTIRGVGRAVAFPFVLGYALFMLTRAFASAKYEQFCFKLDPPAPEVLGPPPQFFTRTETVPATGQPS